MHAKAVELDTHVEWVLIRGLSLIKDVLGHGDFREMQDLVWSPYRDAQRLIAELHDAIARSEGGER